MVARYSSIVEGVAVPNLARISSDITAALGAHAARLARKATNGEGLDAKDVTQLDICSKALARLRDVERDMTTTESGKDVNDMTEEELRQWLPAAARTLGIPATLEPSATDDTDVEGVDPQAGGGEGG